ncbi:MAG: hypothetical protein AB7P23_09540 [Amphiplicatus sp.]
MTATQQAEINSVEASDAEKEMTKYGIKMVTLNYFYYGKYRYTDLRDAVAQAKREASETAARRK